MNKKEIQRFEFRLINNNVFKCSMPFKREEYAHLFKFKSSSPIKCHSGRRESLKLQKFSTTFGIKFCQGFVTTDYNLE